MKKRSETMLSRFGAFLRSSIGKKIAMALTGLLLFGFLVVHVLGNLTLYGDGDGTAFNAYAHKLESLGPVKIAAEVALALLFIAHAALGMRTALSNREARPQRYKEAPAKGERSLASMSMIVTGGVVFVFLVIHIIDFRLAGFGGPGQPTLSELVIARVASPVGASIYFVSMLVLGVHLWHAFQSALQTFGLRHPTYTGAIRCAGMVLAVAVAGAFASFPVLCMMFNGKWPWL